MEPAVAGGQKPRLDAATETSAAATTGRHRERPLVSRLLAYDQEINRGHRRPPRRAPAPRWRWTRDCGALHVPELDDKERWRSPLSKSGDAEDSGSTARCP